MLEPNNDILENYKNFLHANGIQNDILNGLPYDENSIIESFNYFLNLIAINNGNYILQTTPLELHPYLYDHIVDISKHNLVIGTFPPFSYAGNLLNQMNVIVGNIGMPATNYFHGNELSFWKFCADNILSASNFGINDILEFLDRKSTTITDIIKVCQRELVDDRYTAKDTSLINIQLNLDIIKILLNNNSFRKIIFTNSGTNGVNGIKILTNNGRQGEVCTKNRDAFSLFLRACQILNKRVDLALPIIDDQFELNWITLNYQNRLLINDIFKNKVSFKIRLYNTTDEFYEYIVNTPPSPSGEARRGLANNAIYLNQRGADLNFTVDVYRRMIYQQIINPQIDEGILRMYNQL